MITQPMLTSTEQNSSQKNSKLMYESGGPSGREPNLGHRTLDYGPRDGEGGPSNITLSDIFESKVKISKMTRQQVLTNVWYM